MALLTVTDSGPGIAEADRERVMERFVRGTETGNGCGLGLAIVREIIERHRGSVSLGSVSPQGLQVTLALPLAA
jgi:two-component system sensor histidine kinase TctE